jgi:hypothetical protein
MYVGLTFNNDMHGPHLVWKPEHMDAMSAEKGVVASPLFTRPPRREPEQEPKWRLSCGCPSQYGGVPAYWDRDGSTAFGMICEKHWHEYGARSEA